MYSITPKEKPKWYELRWMIAKKLVQLANWIKPSNPDVMAFYTQQMIDLAITDKTITRIDPYSVQEIKDN
jgi:hypothetical protein